MRDLSFFLLKNSLAAKMKKGIRSFCNGVGSTLTLDQRKAERDISCMAAPSLAGSSYVDDGNPAGAAAGSPLTLEQMILQLDMEEAAARRARLEEDDNCYGELRHRRMSCVNSSDVLRSARSALSQYPRFSLDGRDAMYRSSFLTIGEKARGSGAGRKSVSKEHCYEAELGSAARGLPPTVAGEIVVWCKPGVVAKLMGLEAVPVPLGARRRTRVGCAMAGRKQSLRRLGRHELERERLAMGVHGQCCKGMRRESVGSCCSVGGGGRVAQPGYGRPARGRPEWRFARAR